MSKKLVLDRRMELIKLLSEVELGVLNNVLNHELDTIDEDFDYGENDRHYLIVREFELLTRTAPVVLIEYRDIMGEDHSDPGAVIFEYIVDEQYMYLIIDDEVLFSITDHNRVGYFYLEDCYYLVIKPDDIDKIMENKKENWRGKE